MRDQIYRLIKSFFLIAFSFLLIITACHRQVTPKISILPTSSECRVIQHKFGEACIPPNPQRIVVLDPSYTLDPLLSLGFKPVGTTAIDWGGRKYFNGLSADEVKGLEIVGTVVQPSLEKIYMLKPDLILFADWQKYMYKHISDIAPAIPEEREKTKFSFKENLQFIAQLVNRQEKVDELLDQYQRKVRKVRETLGERLNELEVSAVVYNGGNFLIPPSYAGFFQALNDLRVSLKPVFLKQSTWLTISTEIINKYDADILFIINVDNKPPSFYFQNPLIASLKSVQNKTAYVVDPVIWEAYGPLGMNKLLDEISKYLLQAG
ncbi:MAG: putative siderophore-binding lipoprotein YfiY [Chroococcidiopsis sp. SAG 2025]|uniref:iron-siderophore ABC transporter substrate-binding protein n=1 Tax=Chroococcidiopsis sp. SAG 2025 TaxID=171389 RepID=UPI002936D731|nr:iron-siderophore ABC transporter substrate-binding protein [Chroococcidiopsis sp. SAG 2025]MDV2998231.1 putative siderophore-binding lipoprotein YfiY [Chroococcidiopsis sp. SAG 2025]